MLIYLASPINTYQDPIYEQNVNRVKQSFPGAEILLPRDLFTDNMDWLTKWSDILTNLDAVIFFTDRENYIGRGVYQEIIDALAAGKGLFYLTPGGKVISYEQVKLKLVNKSPHQFILVKVAKERKARETYANL